MNYATTVVLISTGINFPLMVVLLLQMGWKNWPKWLMVIPSMALMDLNIFLAACSVSESACNGGKCTPIKAIVVD